MDETTGPGDTAYCNLLWAAISTVPVLTMVFSRGSSNLRARN
jgi:hypothetical protein